MEALFKQYFWVVKGLGLAITAVWILSFVVCRPDDEVLITSKLGIVKAAIFGIPVDSEPLLQKDIQPQT